MAGEGEKQETKMALGRLSHVVREIKTCETQCQGGSRHARNVKTGRLQPAGVGALHLSTDVVRGALLCCFVTQAQRTPDRESAKLTRGWELGYAGR